MALKTVLGWLFNTEHHNVQLPQSMVLGFKEILASLPLPVKLIVLAVQACCALNMEKVIFITNMIMIDFFFLCCPGEHKVTFDKNPFKKSNFQFYQDDKPVFTQSSKLLHAADFLTLTFDTQTNVVKGEHIGHRHSTSISLYPS
jgi:hypothetical protein